MSSKRKFGDDSPGRATAATKGPVKVAVAGLVHANQRSVRSDNLGFQQIVNPETRVVSNRSVASRERPSGNPDSRRPAFRDGHALLATGLLELREHDPSACAD